jgi:tRNA1(Val) A37 N6-methylase TrmN6
MLALLAPDGDFVLIHRADALAALLAAVEGKLGALTLLPVHPMADKPATRLILRGRKGSRAPLTLAPPLILHAGGRFTPRAEALHRGAALE